MDDNSRRVLREIAGLLWEADAARLEAQAQADAGESYTYGEAHAWREAAGQLRQAADRGWTTADAYVSELARAGAIMDDDGTSDDFHTYGTAANDPDSPHYRAAQERAIMARDYTSNGPCA